MAAQPGVHLFSQKSKRDAPLSLVKPESAGTKQHEDFLNGEMRLPYKRL